VSKDSNFERKPDNEGPDIFMLLDTNVVRELRKKSKMDARVKAFLPK
jgi:hypothetical protein